MEDHNDLINQLVPLLQDASFDSLLDQATSHLSSSDRFLVRMELRRLNQDCLRKIDLSGHSGPETREVEICGVSHRLSEEAEQFLQQQIELYEGRYTVGAYEALLDSLKPDSGNQDSHESQSDQPTRPPRVDLLPMGHYIRRRETRHTFSSPITLWQPNGAPMSGRTQDLSIRGAKIKTLRPWVLDPAQPVIVSFTEIASEFTVPELKHGVSYRVIDTQPGEDHTQIRLRRVDNTPNLDQTFERILSVSRLRTRPELNHLLSTAKSRGYERQYLPRLASVPIAMSLKNGKLQPSMALQTESNRSHLNYWLDERGHSQLCSALTEERLARQLKHPGELAHQLLFSFVHHHDNHKLFFSATLFELERQQMSACFFKHASRKTGFRVHRVNLHTISERDKEWASHSPVNGRPSDALVRQQINGMSLLVHLSSLAPEENSGFADYDSDCHINQLRQFGQKRVSNMDPRPLPCQQQELRREPRFSLQTRVLVTHKRDEMVALSVDVSPRGLRLDVEQAVHLPLHETLKLEFPELQPLAGKLKLKQLPYELVRSQKDGKTLHLKAVEDEPHSGVVFLSHLLGQNREKMVQVGSQIQHRQLLEGVKNLVLKRLYSLPFFIHKCQSKLHANLAGNSLLPSTTLQSLIDLHGLNLDAILNNEVVHKQYDQMARSRNEAPAWLSTLILHWPPERELRQAWTLSEIGHPDQVRLKLAQLHGDGHLKVVSLQLNRAQKPDLDYLQAELAAISTHALHRAKELEEMLWQIAVIGELRDITPEFLLQYRLPIEAAVAS
ncbi:PilZ domain-containing protein [Ferrimonas sediminum]|nr:PilZ domain-containing protein [Ferrimonas sediminum]